MVASRESAIIIAVPEAERLVGDLRAKHDPSAAAGVPAHLTLLYPFRAPELIDQSVVDELRAFFAKQPAFTFALTSTERWPGIVYLAPRPEAAFTALISSLAAMFPDTPPYGGAFESVIPHLTVADGVADTVAEQIAEELAPALPIQARAHEALLIEQGSDGRWRTRTVLPLG